MTFVLSDGYMEHGNKNWIKRMKNELLKHGDHNVIILNWIKGSKPPYTQVFKLNNSSSGQSLVVTSNFHPGLRQHPTYRDHVVPFFVFSPQIFLS